MTDGIRVGVVGFGLAGRIFHAAVIAAVPGLELAGIVQRSGNIVQRSGNTVQRSGDSAAQAYPRARIFKSIDDLLADDSIRLIVVATPNSSHYELARQALEAGRDVVVDKPLTLTSSDAAELIRLARDKNLVLAAYQNRRYDGDFLTIKKLLAEGTLGRLVSFESHFDRWRPKVRAERWRENGGPGAGTLYDLGSHLIDQALTLFGAPEAVFADVRTERDGAASDDAFDIRLYYPRLDVLLRSTCLASTPAVRFLLRGTEGNCTRIGLDPQEDALQRGERFDSPHWGEDPEDSWSMESMDPARIHSDNDYSLVTMKLATLPGDYRAYYANVRDALLGVAPLAVPATDAWRTLRVIELARESSERRAALPCDFSSQP